MGIARRVWNRIRDGRHTRDIDDELAFHVDMRTDENIGRGMSPADARLDAERRFGNRTLSAERTRDADILPWLDRMLQDLRYGLRALRSSRWAGAMLLVSLALGIGANTAMFTIVRALIVRPLPVQDPSSLFSVRLGNFSSWGWVEGDGLMNHALWRQLRDQQRIFSAGFAYSRVTLDVSHGGDIQLLQGAYVSAGMWSALGLRPVLGRFTTAEDERLGSASAVAVLGESFWEAEYRRDPAVIGRSVTLVGRPFTIVGVAPARFFGMYVGTRADVYLPLEASAWIEAPENPLANGQRWWLNVVGRLRPDVTPARARRQLDALSAVAMQRTVPADWPKEQAPLYLRQRFELDPVENGFSEVRDSLTRPLLVASGLLVLLLVLACANIATLQLSRGLGRQREFALRIALGASRARLGRQVFLENLLAGAAGATLGLLLASPATRAIAALYSTEWSSLELDLRPDRGVVAFAAGVGVLTAVLFGIAPAFQAMRTEPHVALKSVRATAPSGGSLRQWLLGLQVALAGVLAAVGLMFGATLRNLTTQDTGFDAEHVLLVQFDTNRAGIPKEQRPSFQRTLLERLSTIPGVESVGASYVTPVSGRTWQFNLTVEDAGERRAGHAFANAVSPGFFDAYRTPLLQGRRLHASDRVGAPAVVLVNRAFVRTVLAGHSFVGRRVRGGIGESMNFDAEIVGVVADAKYRDLRSPAPPTVYVPMAQDPTPPSELAVALRARGRLNDLADPLRAAMADLNPEVAYLFRPFEQQIADSVVQERAIAAVSGFFGFLAVVLAGVGIYGLAAYAVVQRRTEIGIRLALGATVRRVLALLFTQMGTIVVAGVAAGAMAAAWGSRVAEALLFDVTPGSLWVYGCAAGTLLMTAALAVVGPTLRAARVDPVETLRAE